MRNKKPDLQPFDWAKHMLKRETDKRAWQALNVQLKILEFTRPLGAKVTCTKQCLLKLAQMRGIIINGVDWDGDWRGMAGGTQEWGSSDARSRRAPTSHPSISVPRVQERSTRKNA